MSLVSETEARMKPALMPPQDETLLLVCLRQQRLERTAHAPHSTQTPEVGHKEA